MTAPDLARIFKEEFNFLLNDELALLLAESAIRHIGSFHQPEVPVYVSRCSNIHPHFGQCVYAEHKGDHYYAQPAEG